MIVCKCKFGKIVEIEEPAEEVVTEEAPSSLLETPEEENKLPLTGRAFFQNLTSIGKDLAWLWLTLVVTIILTLVYFWLKKK